MCQLPIFISTIYCFPPLLFLFDSQRREVSNDQLTIKPMYIKTELLQKLFEMTNIINVNQAKLRPQN